MSQPLADAALDQLFRTARTYNGYLDKPVTEAQLHAIWDLMKMGPTSANQMPARLVWCVTPEAKEKLAALAGGANPDKIRKAPATVIIGMDLDFHEQLPWLFPHTDAKSWFDGNEPLRQISAMRNSTLQGGYFILAARAGAGYRADVGLRQRRRRRRVLRRYAAREIQLHLHAGLWRSRHDLRAQPAPGFRDVQHDRLTGA